MAGPRWRFGSFAAMGKGTRRPQAAKSSLRNMKLLQNLLRPLIRLAFGQPPSPQGEGFWRGSTSHPPGEGLKRADCKIPAVKNRNQPLSSSSFCFSSPSMRPSSTSASFRFWLPSF